MAKLGVRHAVFAKGTYTEGAAPVYSNAQVAGKLAEISGTISHASQRLDLDDQLYLYNDQITGIELNPTVGDLTPAEKQALFGYEASTDDTVVGSQQGTYGGYGYVVTGVVEETGARYYMGYWFYKMVFREEEISHTTLGENPEFGTLPIHGQGMSTTIDTTLDPKWFTFSKRFTAVADAIAWVDAIAGLTA